MSVKEHPMAAVSWRKVYIGEILICVAGGMFGWGRLNATQ